MVDKSSLLIAITTGRIGGTQQTIDYANQKQIDIKILKIKKTISKH